MPAEISEGVFLIDTLGAGTPGLVASYLVKGERSALIDTGYPSSASTLLSELRTAGAGRLQVDFLIPTHVHLDHAGALGHLSKEIPAARVLVSEHGAKHLIDPSRLVESATRVFGDKAMAVYGNPVALPRERVEAVGGEYRLDLGAGKKLKIFWTPGHAWHHMSVLLENERLLITGDAVGLHYPGFDFPIPATPPPGFDQEQYVKNLTGFMDMNLTGLLLPHFGPVRENVGAFLKANIDTIRRWGSEAQEAVRVGKSLDEIFQVFMNDVSEGSGRTRDEIPDHVVRSVRLTAMGCYTYAQAKTGKQ
jgi:glyoxylase-like metal-dependent hydrolase (beta-lactamase superfamily II)